MIKIIKYFARRNLTVSKSIYLSMNGEHTIFFILQDFYMRLSILIHSYGLTSTLVILQISRDNVAISTRQQASKEILLQVTSFTIDHNETRVSATESDLIPAIVPPAVYVGIIHSVSEVHHVVNLTPSMLADPTVTAGIVRVDGWRYKIAYRVLRRVSVEIVKSEGTHDTRSSVRMCQHESNGHLQYHLLLIRHLNKDVIQSSYFSVFNFSSSLENLLENHLPCISSMTCK
ncbi:hypothetical protein ALC60_05674 [Trachymyrmex zeteki]|uniref:Uncharacterized protein n=1 Tax=Mycetomoellerius zeteki TaxID=64791 RepID=A0A151X4X0_9HYME|nr:hypothetical protein ALC60_05674 [Trachymyrmex zeteki]